MKDLEDYSLPELKIKKEKLKGLTNKILIGTLIYTAIIFYFMYNDPDNDGRLLILVPLTILWFILTVLPKRQKVNRLINSKK